MATFGDIALPSRFWAKVRVAEPGCWEWIASRVNGYGRYWPRHGVGRGAHRVAYEAMVGPVAPNLDLDHLCRNRACVNPDHLEPVTRRENALRSPIMGTANRIKTHCAHGHPYDGDNLHVLADGRRKCRACGRENARRYYEKRSAA